MNGSGNKYCALPSSKDGRELLLRGCRESTWHTEEDRDHWEGLWCFSPRLAGRGVYFDSRYSRVEWGEGEFRVLRAEFDGSSEISLERTLELRICSSGAR